MKKLLIITLMSIAIISCGEASSDKSTVEAGTSDTSATLITPASADTASVPGKGTDKIPTRTGATGQGNTTVTGSATGSPTGVKDSVK